MLTLYGVYRSRASRPLWLLHETGMPFRHVPVMQAYRLPDPAAADAPLNTASAVYVAINPQGQVPCLVDGDLVLTESMGITLHLAKAEAAGAVGPRDAGEKALMVQWALHAATAVEGPAVQIMYVVRDGADATPDGQAAIGVEAERLRRPFARLNRHLADHEWMVGARFTAADINTAECVRYAQSQPALLAEFPALSRWLAACQARPGFRAMWALRDAEPA